MASRVTDWVTLTTLKKAIRAEAADNALLGAYLKRAVDWTARVSKVPLMNRTVQVMRRAPSAAYPLRLDRYRYLRIGEAVPRIVWWDADPPMGDGTVLAQAMPRAQNPVRSVGTLLAVEGEPEERGAWHLYPPAGGWPATAQWVRVDLNIGAYPSEHPVLQGVVEAMAAMLWERKEEAEAAKLRDSLLAAYVPEAGYLPAQREREDGT